MYRRNGWQDTTARDGSHTECDSDDYNMSREEYELYRYNIPPRYDGNRFRRNGSRSRTHNEECDRAQPEKETCEPCEVESHSKLTSDNECKPEEHKETSECPCEDIAADEKKSGLLSKLHGSLGGEEILIIALILTVAGSEDIGDLLLLLVLLLLNG